ncbi:unnamed protein product [Owenia fusiformis]|uniref:protein-tyrosine-phosphatase n=1 Tax=Owenia fusiformis TaxID=6347 RepID=A0A8J1U507_OWEFU|nr:unnamed protein product [Owenia fusiformis]
MPVLNIQAVLSEVLEVREGPLSEPELWSILCLGTEALQDLFLKDVGAGHHERGPKFAITPSSLTLTHNGRVRFVTTQGLDSLSPDSQYIPPDMDDVEMNETNIEKMYVYMLGMTLYSAADYTLQESETLNLSKQLDQLLCGMCEEETNNRVALVHVLQACSTEGPLHLNQLSFVHYNIQMYKLLLGSQELDLLPNSEEGSPVSNANVSKHSSVNAATQHSPTDLYSSRSRSNSRSRLGGYGVHPSSSSRSHSLPNSKKKNGALMDRYIHDTARTLLHRDSLESSEDYSNTKYRTLSPRQNSHKHLRGSHNSSNNISNGSSAQGRSYHLSDISLNSNPSHLQSRTLGILEAGRQSRKSRHDTYKRLNERRKKLLILRRGLDIEDYTQGDVVSLASYSTDYGDRKSLISATSYTHGSYRPDLYLKYGSDVALHLARGVGQEDSESSDEDDVSWYQRVHEAQQKQKSRPQAPMYDNSKRRTKLPRPYTPTQDPSSKKKKKTAGPMVVSKTQTKGENKENTKPIQKKKVYYGPEFIVNSNEPFIAVELPSRQKTKVKNLREFTVVLLNGQKLAALCDPTTPCKELLDVVVSYLRLPEHYFFGLTHIKDGEHCFLEPTSKLQKASREGWKTKGQAGMREPDSTMLYFRVKFYADSIESIRHDTTRHLFYLQLRRDILEERSQITPEQAIKLGALAVQAEYGDYDVGAQTQPNYCQIEHYVSQRIIQHLGSVYIMDNLSTSHWENKGLLDHEAEMDFISAFMKTPEYGIHFYRVFRRKNETSSPLWVGVCSLGVLTAETRGGHRIITHKHSWQNTQKLSFNRRRFSVLPKSSSGAMKLTKLSYYTDSYRKGQYLLQFATSHHVFHLKMRARAQSFERFQPNNGHQQESPEPVQSGSQVPDDTRRPRYSQQEYSEQPDTLSQGDVDDAEDMVDYFNDDLDSYEESDQEMPNDDQMDIHEVSNDQHHEPNNSTKASRTSKYSNRTPMSSQRPPSNTDSTPPEPPQRSSASHYYTEPEGAYGRPKGAHSRLEGAHPHAGLHSYNQRGHAPTYESPMKTPKAYVVDESVHSVDKTLLPAEETISDSLYRRMDNIPSPEVPERRVIVVELTKVVPYGIGLTIVGGESTNSLDLGIFVKSIIPEGPAHRDGRLQVGDRIIAINGQSLEGMAHNETVGLIKQSPGVVQLLVSQLVPLRGTPSPLPVVGSSMDTHMAGRSVMSKMETPHSGSNARSQNSAYRQHQRAEYDKDNHTGNYGNTDTEVEMILPQARTIPKPPRKSSKSRNSADISNQGSFMEKPPRRAHSGFSSPRSKVGDQSQDMSQNKPVPVTNQNSLPEQSIPPPIGFNQQQQSKTGYESEDSFESDIDDMEASYGAMRTSIDADPEDNASSSDEELPGLQHVNPSELKEGDTYKVVLHKLAGSLGLNITGGVNTSVKHGGIYVKSLVPGGVSDRDSKIQVGDRVLEINGQSLTGFTHKQAVQTLRESPDVCTLYMERGVLPKNSRMETPKPMTPSPFPSTSTPTRNTTEGTYSSPALTVGKEAEFTTSDATQSYPSQGPTPSNSNPDTAQHTKQPEGATPKRSLFVTPGESSYSQSPNTTVEEDISSSKYIPSQNVNKVDKPSRVDEHESYIPTGLKPNNMLSDTRDDTRTTRGDTSPTKGDISTTRGDISTTRGDISTTRGEASNNKTDPKSVQDDSNEFSLSLGDSWDSSPDSTLNDSFMTDTPKDISNPPNIPPLPLSPPPGTLPPSQGSLPPASDIDKQDVSDKPREAPDFPFVTKENTFDVPLQKGSQGLGFSVIGGRGSHSTDPLQCIARIRKIFPLGPAASSGKMEVGDIILEVNGKKLKGLSHNETVTLLRTTPSEVHLLLSRPDPGVLPPIADIHDVSYDRDIMSSPVKSPPSQSVVQSPLLTPKTKESKINNQTANNSKLNNISSPGGSAMTSTLNSRNETPTLEKTESQSVGQEYSQTQSSFASNKSVVKSPDKNSRQSSFQKQSNVNSETESDSEFEFSLPDSSVTATPQTQSEAATPYTRSGAVTSESSFESSYDESTTTTPRLISRDASMKQTTKTPSNSTKNDEHASTEKVMSPIRTPGAKSATDSTASFNVIFDDNKEYARDVMTPSLHDSSQSYIESPPQGGLKYDDNLKPGEFEVSLTKADKGGLGFTVAGSSGTTGGCFVKAVVQEPALSNGRIRPGDKLIQVNEQDMRDFTHVDAVSYLRKTPQTVIIRLFRDPSLDLDITTSPEKSLHEPPHRHSTPRRKSDSDSWSTSDEGSSGVPKISVKNMINNFNNSASLIKPKDYKTQDVKPQDRNSLENETKNEDIDGDGSKPGLLSPGDRKDKSDSRDRTSSFSSFGDVSLPLSGGEESSQKPSDDITTKKGNESGQIIIELEKSQVGGLGFSLTGAKKGIFVKTITKGGPAEKDGRLRVGDRILQINDETVIGMTHSKAVTILRKAKNSVVLAVSRPKDDPSNNLRKHSGASQPQTGAPSPRDPPSRPESREDFSLGSMISNNQTTDSELDFTFEIPEDKTPLRKHSDSQGHPVASTPELYQSGTGTGTYNSGAEDRIQKYKLPPLPRDPPPDSDTDSDSSWGDNDSVPLPGDESYQSNMSANDSISAVTEKLTDDWLDNMEIVKTVDGRLYSGRALENTIGQLKGKIEQDDPIEEYKDLRQVKATDHCSVAKQAKFKTKNRYRNVLPYDKNRVQLSTTPDYINASHIRIHINKDTLHYIASQGPLPNTTPDFWQMVWDYKVKVIAMVTLDVEGGKVKCHRYWPDSAVRPITVFDRYEVSLVKLIELEKFDVRQLKMTDRESGTSHNIVHLNYTGWPDHGVPHTARSILQYVQLIHTFNSGGPIIVHCSAGIGRTGAIITIDTVLANIQRDHRFDIHEIVHTLRKQRQGMIQTKDQYLFCYSAASEALQFLLNKDEGKK